MAFDLTKLNKVLDKKLKGSEIEIGLREVDTWVDTGCYVLNNVISGDFNKGFPMGKSMVLVGEPGSGKSLIAANIAKHAQKMGILPIFMDTERALDTSYLQKVGVDTSDGAMMRADIITVAQAQNFIVSLLGSIDEAYPEGERPQVLFVLDSLGGLMTDKEWEETQSGDMKADMGTRAKQLRAFMKAMTHKCGIHNAGLIATNHLYLSADKHGNVKKNQSGGKGPEYAASIILFFDKKEQKVSDADKAKNKEMASPNGVDIIAKVTKTRFTKPFRKVEINVPYVTGIDVFSGLLDTVVMMGLVEKNGGWYTVKSTGEKFQESNRKTKDILAKILSELGNIEVGTYDASGYDGDKDNQEVLMEGEE